MVDGNGMHYHEYCPPPLAPIPRKSKENDLKDNSPKTPTQRRCPLFTTTMNQQLFSSPFSKDTCQGRTTRTGMELVMRTTCSTVLAPPALTTDPEAACISNRRYFGTAA